MIYYQFYSNKSRNFHKKNQDTTFPFWIKQTVLLWHEGFNTRKS